MLWQGSVRRWIEERTWLWGGCLANILKNDNA